MNAVLFDLDDTLFDHRRSSRTALAVVHATHGCFRRWTLEDLIVEHARVLEDLHARVVSGTTSVDDARTERFSRLIDQAGGRATRSEVQTIAAEYRRCYLETRQPVAGALALLRHLKGRVKIGVVSNNIVAEQVEKLRHCGLEAFVDVLVVSEEVGIAKPDPRIFLIAMDRLDCKPDTGVMVGDSWEWDVVGARAAGLSAVWFNGAGAPLPEPSMASEIRALEPAEEIAKILLGTR